MASLPPLHTSCNKTAGRSTVCVDTFQTVQKRIKTSRRHKKDYRHLSTHGKHVILVQNFFAIHLM